MTGGLNTAVQCCAVENKDKRCDGAFYFAVKDSGVYCRPSCPAIHAQHNYVFFDTTAEAAAQGYRACARCHPDKLNSSLSQKILGRIEAGAINDQGVHGLADSLHISERHLRRLVKDRTGTSPLRLNKAKRLSVAKRLVVQTELSIIDIAFNAEFSSLRQFNAVFKETFRVSPREMRKIAATQYPVARSPESSITNEQ